MMAVASAGPHAICTSLQTDNHANTSSLNVYGAGALPVAQPTASKHRRQETVTEKLLTHTHPFNGPLSGTTQVSRYQKGRTNLNFTGARDREWQWLQLGHM